jgi:hypothetical protein
MTFRVFGDLCLAPIANHVLEGFYEDLACQKHRRTPVPAPARVSALSYMGFSHCRSVLKTTIKDTARSAWVSALIDLVSTCLSVFNLFVYHLIANPIACASFRCLKTALSSIRTFRLALNPAHPLPLPYHFPAYLPSRWSPLRPPALAAPLKTQLSNSPDSPTSAENGASIPITKASKQELITGLEQYFRRHGEYPNNYPGGPQDL